MTTKLGIVAVVAAKFAVEIKPVFNKAAVVIPVEAFKVPVDTFVTTKLGIVAVVDDKFAVEIKPVFNKAAVVIPVEAFKVPVLKFVCIMFGIVAVVAVTFCNVLAPVTFIEPDVIPETDIAPLPTSNEETGLVVLIPMLPFVKRTHELICENDKVPLVGRTILYTILPEKKISNIFLIFFRMYCEFKKNFFSLFLIDVISIFR